MMGCCLVRFHRKATIPMQLEKQIQEMLPMLQVA